LEFSIGNLEGIVGQVKGSLWFREYVVIDLAYFQQCRLLLPAGGAIPYLTARWMGIAE
jgi:hypothetical protein